MPNDGDRIRFGPNPAGFRPQGPRFRPADLPTPATEPADRQPDDNESEPTVRFGSTSEVDGDDPIKRPIARSDEALDGADPVQEPATDAELEAADESVAPETLDGPADAPLPGEVNAPQPLAPPRVFVSYRRADRGTVAKNLAKQLRRDLGPESVFRDQDDLRPGDRWRSELHDAIDTSDSALFLVGPDWVGPLPGGEARINDEDDVVRTEVLTVLENSESCHPRPILLDEASPPGNVDDSIAELFEFQAMKVTSAGLTDPLSPEYQGALLTIWDALRRKRPNGVMLIGEPGQIAPLDELVDEMEARGAIEVGNLSRFLSGCYIGSLTAKTKQKSRPQILFAIDDQPSPVMAARLEAAKRYFGLSVALIGAGAAGAFASAGLGQGGGAGTFVLSSGSTAAVPTTGTGALASFAGAGIGAKVTAATAGLLAASALTVGVVNAIDDPEEFNLAFADSTTLSVIDGEDERSFPLGSPPAAEIRLGTPIPTDSGLQSPTGEPVAAVTREVLFTMGDGFDQLSIGSVTIPLAIPEEGFDPTAERVLLASTERTVELSAAPGIPAGTSCINDSDPTEVIGGYNYTEGSYSITALVTATLANGQVNGTEIQVELSGPADLQLFGGAAEDIDLTRCLAETSHIIAWSS